MYYLTFLFTSNMYDLISLYYASPMRHVSHCET